MADDEEVKERAKGLGRLWWLVDAPLFVDHELVARLHDAIIWPQLENETIEKANFSKVSGDAEVNAEIGGGAEWSLPDFLKWISPKLKANAKLAAAANLNSESGKSTTTSGRLVDNSERKLNELVLEYLSEFPDRVVFVDVPGGSYSNHKGSLNGDAIKQLLLSPPPRPLVFMDIQPGSPIFPTMIEMEEGGFRPVFEKLDQKLLSHENPTPKYDENPAKRKEYWTAVKNGFQSRSGSRTAMVEIESACGEGRIGWIDFRLLFKDDGESAHLHVVPAGRYHAGVFGYNFVHRGYKYGCRIVGSLKSGNDVNVLAIYER